MWRAKGNFPSKHVSSLLRLICDSFNPSSDLFLVTKVTALKRSNGIGMRDGLEIIIELINQWNARRYVQSADFLVGDVVQILHKCTKSIAMSRDNDLLSRLDVGPNLIFPIRHEPLTSRLETLRKLVIEFDSFVSRIIRWMVLAGPVYNGRGDVVRSPPDKNLLLAMFVHRLLLVETLKSSVYICLE